MLDRGVLSRLYVLTEQDSFTLTMYLDIDQNRQSNRNRGHLVQAEALLKDLGTKHGKDDQLARASATALELVSAIDPKGRTVLVVVHPATELAEIHQIKLSLPVSVHWRRGTFLRPVVEAMDENERYGVVLTDKQRARLFTLYMGELTEHSDLFSDTTKRTRATGTDQWRAQKRHQRHHEREVALHAKSVVDALRDLALRSPFDRLIVAGPIQAASQVARLLPRRLHGKLIETVSMAINATAQEVHEGIEEIRERMERQQESALVDGLVAELHDGGKALAGAKGVVDAVNQGRVWKLFYAREYAAQGGECRGCGRYSEDSAGACPVCDDKLQSIPDFVNRLSQEVLELGGQVEVVAGRAAVKLQPHGSVAALLRY